VDNDQERKKTQLVIETLRRGR